MPNHYNPKKGQHASHKKQSPLAKSQPVAKNNPVFVFTEELPVSVFASRLQKPAGEIIKYFFMQKIMLRPDTVLSKEQMFEVCLKFNFEWTEKPKLSLRELIEQHAQIDDKGTLQKRWPVVTIMGHVDHGKTTLLDYLRSSNMIDKEFGGITQQIGAYTVDVPNITNQKITFIDTPGHEAFTEMRARGTMITDIVILVVAANDGVQKQTIEAINHVKAANVPIIVFINKMDLPNVDSSQIKINLSQHDLITEDFGGEVPVVEGSALKGTNVDKLLEMIDLVASLRDLKANYQQLPFGVVIEAKLDRNTGPVATLLIQNGTLQLKDRVVTSHSTGYVRNMINDQNIRIKQAIPSSAVQIQGLDKVPQAGERFIVFRSEKNYKHFHNQLKAVAPNYSPVNISANKITIKDLNHKFKDHDFYQLNLIIKADTNGILEAIKSMINKIKKEKVAIKIIHAVSGGITNSDVILASASKAMIIAFNVTANATVRQNIKNENVSVRYYNVIYKIAEDLEQIIEGFKTAQNEEVFVGQAQVKQLFYFSGVGNIAGCYVSDGQIKLNASIRLIRNEKIIYKGEIASLKHLQQNITVANKGRECGIVLKNYNDIKVDDIIECFTVEKK